VSLTVETGRVPPAPPVGTRAARGARTLRTDRWWLQPLLTVVVLTAFIAYATWVAFVDRNYYVRPYLSPMYSPCLMASCKHATWQVFGHWHLASLTVSPALLILPFPLLFRLTCYYYRKAYYRGFWLSPPACAVAEPHRSYSGETRFPLVLQNLHRYAFYLALPFPFILLWETFKATDFPGGFGIGLGTVILFVNACLLGAYTLSCHSCRHLCGGGLDMFSKSPLRYKAWRFVSRLNQRHMQIAWVSLFGVALTDLYVRLVAGGAFHDPRIF
jgi:hypothetical protein